MAWKGGARRGRGLTLIEVLIAVAIVAVLTAIAVPMYSQYLVRGQRAAAKTALLQMSQAMERYYTACGTYATTTTGPCAGTISSTVVYPLSTFVSGSTGCNAMSPASGGATYCLSAAPLPAVSPTSYTLQAVPCGDGGSGCPAGTSNLSFTDPACDVLMIDNTGLKSVGTAATSPASQCWQQ
jgi:type IV pilus assembly protein PilE